MAELPEHIRLTLDELRSRLNEKVREAKQTLTTLNSLEADYGQPITPLSELMETDAPPALEGAQPFKRVFSGEVHTAPQRLPVIRPDHFLGMQPLDAAKSFLGMVGHALSVDEIADAVKRGGAAIVGAIWKERLEESLTRSVADVVKVQDHTFGLVRFYTEDQIKGIRGTRRQISTGKKKRGRSRKKQNQETTKKKQEPRSEPTPDQINRIRELKAEGKTLAEIAHAVGLHHLAVYRILGGKPKKAEAA
jgi:hypothetical protein